MGAQHRADGPTALVDHLSQPFREGPQGVSDRKYPTTPDGRYFVVRGRLWRASNPALSPDERERLVKELMAARRAVGVAKWEGNAEAEAEANEDVNRAKVALGERGPVWWDDCAPDLTRNLAHTGPYAEWYAGLSNEQR